MMRRVGIARQEDGDRIKANALIEKLGGIPRSVADFDAIKSIGAKHLGKLCYRIDELQRELMDKLPHGLFQIGEEEYLLSWFCSEVKWNEGERLRRTMTRVSQGNSKPMMSERCAY